LIHGTLSVGVPSPSQRVNGENIPYASMVLKPRRT
jgi:hypothetical protein